jgi:hypothetical protein
MLKNMMKFPLPISHHPNYKTTTHHFCADTLNISNIKKAIGDVMVCVLTLSVVVDRWPNHKL